MSKLRLFIALITEFKPSVTPPISLFINPIMPLIGVFIASLIPLKTLTNAFLIFVSVPFMLLHIWAKIFAKNVYAPCHTLFIALHAVLKTPESVFITVFKTLKCVVNLLTHLSTSHVIAGVTMLSIIQPRDLSPISIGVRITSIIVKRGSIKDTTISMKGCNMGRSAESTDDIKLRRDETTGRIASAIRVITGTIASNSCTNTGITAPIISVSTGIKMSASCVIMGITAANSCPIRPTTMVRIVVSGGNNTLTT